MRARFALSALVALVVACGGLGDEDAGDTNLPSTGMGPFRALTRAEVNAKATAPFVVDDKVGQYTDPAALDNGLYVITSGQIAHTAAPDGRTFDAPAVVLKADPSTWEGIVLSGPWALHVGPETWLYYAAKGGVGLATSTDGKTFTKKPGPVLAGAKSPSVFVLPDGRYRMMYSDGANIAEAESTDGLSWRALGPVLAPATDPTAFDASAVGDPCVVPQWTPGNRYQVRVLYTGTDATKKLTQIGFAARYGTDGPLTRNTVAAYATGKGPGFAAPFLYVTQVNGNYGAVAAAVMPGTVLPAP